MTINEMKQRILLCAATLRKLNGFAPGIAELSRALGSEYAALLAAYYSETGAVT